MKIIIVFALSLMSLTLFSQKKIEVKSGSEKFSVGNVDVLITDVYEADVKSIRKAWKKLLKNYSGSVKMKSEIFADDVLIKSMSNNTVDIYTKIEEKKGKPEDGKIVTITCAVDLGGAYLSKSQHPDKFKTFKEILRKFVVEVSKEAVRDEINEQEKIFSGMEKKQEELVSDNEKMHKEIEEYKQKIKDNEKAIEQNVKDQEAQKKTIDEQKVIITSLRDKERAIK